MDRCTTDSSGLRPPEEEPVSGSDALPRRQPRADRDTLVSRNSNFTGRDAVLRQLREELRSRGTRGRPAATDHPGHRRRRQDAGGAGVRAPIQGRLRRRLVAQLRAAAVHRRVAGRPGQAAAGAVRRASVPEEGGVDEVARQVLALPERAGEADAGSSSTTTPRTSTAIERLLPSGGGHVLITSRDERWEACRPEQGAAARYFEREESVSHLRRRLPAIAAADADRLAAELGDMPLAVAAAGALLASGDMTVSEYLAARAAAASAAADGAPAARVSGGGRRRPGTCRSTNSSAVRGGRPAAGDLRRDGAGDRLGPDLQRGDGGHSQASRRQHHRALDDRQAGQADRPARADQGGLHRPPGPGAPGRAGPSCSERMSEASWRPRGGRAHDADRGPPAGRRGRPADVAAVPA